MSEKKKCSNCEKEKFVGEFNLAHGGNSYQARCKSCSRLFRMRDQFIIDGKRIEARYLQVRDSAIEKANRMYNLKMKNRRIRAEKLGIFKLGKTK